MSATICKTCQASTDTLALFPGGICLACYEITPEARKPITAQELARMWGARI